jgi:hypothetical protein
MEPSSRGVGNPESSPVVNNRGGVGNNRWANKLTGEGANDKGDGQGDENEDRVMSVGEKILE